MLMQCAICNSEEVLSSLQGATRVPPAVTRAGRGGEQGQGEEGQMELKLNVTDSQLVLVEDASVWDTNAVILKVRSMI